MRGGFDDPHSFARIGELIRPSSWERPFVPKREGTTVKSLSSRSWSGIAASVTELVCDGPYFVELYYDCARLTVMLDLVGAHPEARVERSRRGPDPGSSVHHMNFAPARTAMWAMSDRTRYMRHVSFTFGDEAVRELLDEEIDSSAFVPRPLFFDQTLFQIAKLLATECDGRDASPRLYGDGLSVALLLRLAALGKATCRQPAKGGLPPHRLRLVTDYLHAHLAENVSLRELATIAQLSRSQFSRAFRASTGLSAHQWLLNARIESAKEFLLFEKLSIAEIALLTGFADQAHFSRQFGRIVGSSPSSWRRQVAS